MLVLSLQELKTIGRQIYKQIQKCWHDVSHLTGWFMGVSAAVKSESLRAAVLVSPEMRQSSATCRLRLRYFLWDSGNMNDCRSYIKIVFPFIIGVFLGGLRFVLI